MVVRLFFSAPVYGERGWGCERTMDHAGSSPAVLVIYLSSFSFMALNPIETAIHWWRSP